MQPNSSKKRFSYSVIIALALHALGLLAFGFSWANTPSHKKSIEVTLAQHQASKKNDDADFYAQIDQLGSGSGDNKQRLLKQQLTIPHDQSKVGKTADSPTKTSQKSAKPTETKRFFENSISSFDVVNSIVSNDTITLKQKVNNSNTASNKKQDDTLSAQIVALKSQINLRRQEIAKAPKKRTVSTMSTKSHQDAEYLENWRRRIVTVGNIHYPKAANDQEIYGRVRLLIAMQADGNIKSIEILESSGKQILDNSAVKIIRLAAPFQPFPEQMRTNTDILEIIRTIEFEKTTLIY